MDGRAEIEFILLLLFQILLKLDVMESCVHFAFLLFQILLKLEVMESSKILGYIVHDLCEKATTSTMVCLRT